MVRIVKDANHFFYTTVPLYHFTQDGRYLRQPKPDMRTTTSILMLFCCCLCSAQTWPLRQAVTPTDVANALYGNVTFLSSQCYEAVRDGKLTAYKDSSFTSRYSQEDFNNLGIFREQIQIINPLNLDDVYDLIDTTVLSPFDPFTFHSLVIGGKNIRYVMNDLESCYFKKSDVKKVVAAEQKWLLSYWENNLGTVISTARMPVIGQDKIRGLGMLLYKTGISGNLKAYRNDSLTSFYAAEELPAIGTSIDHMQSVDPLDPSNVTEILLSRLFDPTGINRVFFSLVPYSNGGKQFVFNYQALAPTYRPMIGGIELPLQSMFWIRQEDTKKYLNTEEQHFWSVVLFYAIQKNIHPDGVPAAWEEEAE